MTHVSFMCLERALYQIRSSKAADPDEQDVLEATYGINTELHGLDRCIGAYGRSCRVQPKWPLDR